MVPSGLSFHPAAESRVEGAPDGISTAGEGLLDAASGSTLHRSTFFPENSGRICVVKNFPLDVALTNSTHNR